MEYKSNKPARLETRFFGYVQSQRRNTVMTGDLASALAINPSQEKKLLSRLARSGLIARVRRGLYLVPPRIPPGGRWAPSESLALSTLMTDLGARYQISGLNAFSRYGWDEQVPNRVFAYNDRLSGRRTIGSVEFTLVKVGDDRLGATETVRDSDGTDLVYSSKSRALIDAVYDWSRFNTLPRAFDWIRNELRKSEGGLAAELVDVAVRFGNQGTMRRIGWLLEEAGEQQTLLRKIEKSLRRTSSFIPLVPTRRKQGRVNPRWMLVINDG
jgi:predicted transcriptional regulator of viral defense system